MPPPGLLEGGVEAAMVLDDEVGEGGREAGLDGERPRAGRRAEGGEEAAQAAAGGGALQRAGGWHRRPTPASIGGAGERARETRKRRWEERKWRWLLEVSVGVFKR